MWQVLLLVILTLTAHSLAANNVPETASTSKSKVESLESELKKKLKDNNEDYADRKKRHKLEERGQLGNESRRAFWIGDSAPEDVDSSSDTFNAIPRTPSMKAIMPDKSLRRGKGDDEVVDRHKIQKLRRFVQQNKNLLGGVVNMQKLEELMSKTTIDQTLPAGTPETTSLFRFPSTMNRASTPPHDPGIIEASKNFIYQQINELLGFDIKQKLRDLLHLQGPAVQPRSKAVQPHADLTRPPQPQPQLGQLHHNKYEDDVLKILFKDKEVPHEADATLPRPRLKSEAGLQHIKQVQLRPTISIRPRLTKDPEYPPEVQRHFSYPGYQFKAYDNKHQAVKKKGRIVYDQKWYFGHRTKKVGRSGDSNEAPQPTLTTIGTRSTRDPRDLDLAPAHGGRVSVLRSKGRICQRNVMIPEGAKYDSKGKVYLKAFKPRRGSRMDYARTIKPDFILPKCCNCCKKSVLGCV